jgi:hypothetical protein
MSKKKKAKKRVRGPQSGANTVPNVQPAALVTTHTNSPGSAGRNASNGNAVAASAGTGNASAGNPGREKATIDPRWGYVGEDVRRTGSLALVCVAIELLLLYLFNHTGLGSTVYNWIKL